MPLLNSIQKHSRGIYYHTYTSSCNIMQPTISTINYISHQNEICRNKNKERWQAEATHAILFSHHLRKLTTKQKLALPTLDHPCPPHLKDNLLEELQRKISKYSNRLREYARHGANDFEEKQKGLKSHQKMVSSMHRSILERMLMIIEQCN